MTNEEILGCWALHGPEPYEVPVEMEKDSILQAMEEYTKQEIIEFEHWKRRQGVLFMQQNLTTPADELYTLYQQSKQK